MDVETVIIIIKYSLSNLSISPYGNLSLSICRTSSSCNLFPTAVYVSTDLWLISSVFPQKPSEDTETEAHANRLMVNIEICFHSRTRDAGTAFS